MRAALFGQPGSIGLVEADLPEPEPGWVRLATGAVGICGTDLHLMHGMVGSVAGLQPGHEVAGTVDVVGDDVDLAAGTRVAVEPLHGCGECAYCAGGLHNLCTRNRLFGVTAKGGMADFLVVPVSCLHVVPDDLDMHVAALSEPMAVCVRAVRLAAVGLRDRVVVLGAGSIGLCAIVAARHAGAAEIYATARYPQQAELASALGADAVFSSGAALLEAVGQDTVDVVLETVGGRADTLTESVRIARRGGRVAVIGLFEGAPGLPGFEFVTKELTLVGSNCYGRNAHHGDFALAAEIVAAERDLIAPLVTHEFKLDQVADAFAAAEDKSAGVIKVQIVP